MAVKYKPTLHAIDRLKHRLNVPVERAERWLNEAMRKAKYVISQKRNGRSQLIYEYNGVRLVVDPERRTLITVVPSADISLVKPLFERERRRLEREVTRNMRALELEKAKILVEYGKMAVNKARARNPQTRALIQERMDAAMKRAADFDSGMEAEKDKLANFDRAVGVFV